MAAAAGLWVLSKFGYRLTIIVLILNLVLDVVESLAGYASAFNVLGALLAIVALVYLTRPRIRRGVRWLPHRRAEHDLVLRAPPPAAAARRTRLHLLPVRGQWHRHDQHDVSPMLDPSNPTPLGRRPRASESWLVALASRPSRFPE